MSSDGARVGDLLKCWRHARNPAEMQKCEHEFLAAGGRVETWRVFIDPDGKATAVGDGKVYDCRYLFDLNR